MKTLTLRMERQIQNCQKIAAFLERHPLVKSLYYPGLPSHPGFAINQKQVDETRFLQWRVVQAKSGGSLLSFTTNSVDASQTIASETALFKIAVSFGSVISSIGMPCFMSHAAVPADVRAARGLPDDLIRISAGRTQPLSFVNDEDCDRGIEDGDDLIADLDQAMQKALALLESRKPVSESA